ncbi:MAG: glycogen synthase GlgA, partial [Betaproteobacteria bacterium]|nr:glycogen synthase GlgA [Betaproteobacteria bacterium]
MRASATRAAAKRAGGPGTGPRVLLVSSEIHPLAKTGGLADVCAALPRALARYGADVRLLMPAYESALDRLRGPRTVAHLGEMLGVPAPRLIEGTMPDSALPVWLLDCPALYRRPGTPYLDANGGDWPDNWLRFGLLAHAAARIARGEAHGAWRPDALHCHDWQTGLAPYLVGRSALPRPRTLFTVHNAAFQGNFPTEHAQQLGLPGEALSPEALEFWGRISFLKAGVRYADRVNTVSPTYARELRTPEYGCGMEGLFEQRAGDLVGILNGIDTELWDPRRADGIAAHYSADAPQGKAACKAALQAELGLAADPQAPLVAFASRITWQKMADVTLERLPALLAAHPRLQFALLGTGERALERGFQDLAPHFRGRVSVRIAYAEDDEHRLQAGADVLLHGSRYEPCGLAHKIAMRYGALPVVRRTGGLADTVSEGDNGFMFEAPAGEDLQAALGRCLATYEHQPGTWGAMRERAMRGDYSWERPALEYLRL